MDFIKKNYEKILLGLVLAGLIGVLVFMFFYIAADQQVMSDRSSGYIKKTGKVLEDLNLTAQSNIVARIQSPYVLDFTTVNKLFNPVEWQKGLDGNPIKISSDKVIGPGAVVVTNIDPLYLILTLDSVTTNELGVRYVVGIEKQAEKSASKRRKQTHYVSVGDKNETFQLVSIKGAPENPDALVLKLTDSGETATIPRGQAFKRVDDYAADFRYDPEKKVFRDRRVGDKVAFGGADYVVVEVSSSELTLADQSNQKKTSLPFTP